MRYAITTVAVGVQGLLVVFNQEWFLWMIGRLDFFWITTAAAAGATLLLILAEASLIGLLEGTGPPFSGKDFVYSWGIGSFSAVAAGFCMAVANVATGGGLLTGVVTVFMVGIPIWFTYYVQSKYEAAESSPVHIVSD
ncbi:MAG: hypothetical protein Q7S63_01790 [bacterium]|nr:hypothetical protein [bacterium]